MCLFGVIYITDIAFNLFLGSKLIYAQSDKQNGPKISLFGPNLENENIPEKLGSHL